MEQQIGNGTTVNGTAIKRTKSRESKPTDSHSDITFFPLKQTGWNILYGTTLIEEL